VSFERPLTRTVVPEQLMNWAGSGGKVRVGIYLFLDMQQDGDVPPLLKIGIHSLPPPPVLARPGTCAPASVANHRPPPAAFSPWCLDYDRRLDRCSRLLYR
jgi:hypothetical protein